jgi:hypothetical protein
VRVMASSDQPSEAHLAPITALCFDSECFSKSNHCQISDPQRPAATGSRPSVLGWLRHATAVNRLIRQTHDERQGNIQPRNILFVKMTDPPSNSFAPDRDGLVGHDLRPHSQAVCRRRIDRHAKIRCVAALRGHLANHHRCMTSREGLRLHDHRRPRLAIVARRSNRNHVAALHPRSNSDTASIHPNAASSCARSKPATSLATRLRIAFDRASGTTRRNSLKPRACRRSRIALIRSAAAIVFPQ